MGLKNQYESGRNPVSVFQDYLIQKTVSHIQVQSKQ